VKIGQVAERAGVSVHAVRFYERRGVLPAAERRPSGHRAFTPDAVERIRTAKALQALGFTLDEVIDALHAQGTCDRLDAKIADLENARRDAMDTMRACRSGRCVRSSCRVAGPVHGRSEPQTPRAV
jgi:DNA-binding transcriptional MerR regulator